MLHEAVVKLSGKHRYVDLACNQCVDCLAVIQLGQNNGVLRGSCGLQNLQHERSQRGSRHANRQTLATELAEPSNALRACEKNEYWVSDIPPSEYSMAASLGCVKLKLVNAAC